MRIEELAQVIEGELILSDGFIPVDIKGVTLRSYECQKGIMFAAVRGSRLDGGDFVADAYQRGARVFLSDRLLPLRDGCALIKCKNLRKSLAVSSSALNSRPQDKLRIIGVTGTKGKTTVGSLIADMLNNRGIPTAFIGTLGVSLRGERIACSSPNTTPDSDLLFPILADLVRRGADTVVLEVSSQALKDYRLYGITLFAAVFTSMGLDHIGEGEHSSFSEYVACKRRLFTAYGARVAFLNADDEYSEYMGKRTEKRILCGFSASADYRLAREKEGYSLNGEPFSSKLPGDFNAVNISLAVALCHELYGIPIAGLLSIAEEAVISGRFEYRKIRGRHTVIDYAHNAMSFRQVISLARGMFSGRIFLVFGSVGGRCFSRRRELAEVAEELADYSLITTDDPLDEPPLDICADIYSSFSDRSRAEIVLDRERAIRRAFYLSRPDDVILLLGKGHEEFMRIGGERIAFSERKILDGLRYGALSEL